MDLCKTLSVSFSLNYSEASDDFSITIHSAAPTENWIGKSTDFESAIQYAIDWLNSLLLKHQNV